MTSSTVSKRRAYASGPGWSVRRNISLLESYDEARATTVESRPCGSAQPPLASVSTSRICANCRMILPNIRNSARHKPIPRRRQVLVCRDLRAITYDDYRPRDGMRGELAAKRERL